MAGLASIDIDPIPSPSNSVDSMDTNSTPNTEYSPPDSPFQEHPGFMKNKRLAARKKLAQLTQEEKVSLLTAADFWRTKSIPEKNIPAVKTSDGPNGARGGIFVGGTKVSSLGIM